MVKARSSKAYNFLIALADAAVVAASYLFSLFIFITFRSNDIHQEQVFGIIPVYIAFTMILLFAFDFYTSPRKTTYEIIITGFLTTILCNLAIVFFAYLIRWFGLPRLMILIESVVQLSFLSVWRVLLVKINKRLTGKVKLAVIAPEDELYELFLKIQASCKDLYDISIIGSDFAQESDITKMIEPTEFIVISPAVSHNIRKSVVTQAMLSSKQVFIIPDLYDINLVNSKVIQFDDIPAFHIQRLGLSSSQKMLKRLMDIVLSVVGILITSPVMLIVAAAIKLTSKGPILYTQDRVTENNRIFKVYKFRTMIDGAEKKSGPVLAAENDPRITGVGSILRTARIDELPQLFNILLGDMSIVGPRPERPVFVNQFKEEIENYEARSMVKAGLTGYAQVQGRYNTTPKDKLLYDLMYIRKYSVWLDLKFILSTLKILFMKESTMGVNAVSDLNTAETQEYKQNEYDLQSIVESTKKAI